MTIDPTPGTEAEDCEQLECERFPVDRFEQVNVKEISLGFHTLGWTDNERRNWEQGR